MHQIESVLVKPIVIVVATRKSANVFWTQTATGQSLAYYRYPFVQVELCADNQLGFSEIYNQVIDKYLAQDVVLVFVHDNVWITDLYWTRTLFSGLASYDVVGLVGNRQCTPTQPSWNFLDTQGTWDVVDNLSGVIAHGTDFPPKSLGVFGPVGPVKLLDGVFLATTSQVLHDAGLRFDTRFTLHFYDMDWCRTAHEKGLRMGTIALSVVHQDSGNFNSRAWLDAYQLYLDKWIPQTLTP